MVIARPGLRRVPCAPGSPGSADFCCCRRSKGRALEERAPSQHADGGTAMELRLLGRTGLQLSVLGFGCGPVGGLMVRADPPDREPTIARAIGAALTHS